MIVQQFCVNMRNHLFHVRDAYNIYALLRMSILNFSPNAIYSISASNVSVIDKIEAPSPVPSS